jgi:CHASE3 domain sensor protein
MKKLLTLSLLLFSISLYAKHIADTALKNLDSEIKKGEALTDSINKVTDSLINSRNDKIFQETMHQNERNMEELLRERDEKLRRDAIRNIGIGIGFAAILVIGLLRRRKKNK